MTTRSSRQKRVETLKALVAGSILATNTANLAAIQSEFDETVKVEKVPTLNRRRLLQVLHSTRALDTTLATFVIVKGCFVPTPRSPRPTSLGSCLKSLERHGVSSMNQLSAQQRRHYQVNTNFAL